MWLYYGFSPLAVILAWLRAREIAHDWPQFKGRTIIPTHIARISIALAFKALKLSPGDEVLVPSFNCGSEIDPLIWCGAKPVFYRVDEKVEIDPEDIISRVTEKTRVVYITHFFGWPHKVAELADWCKERNILLIEDCALALFSAGPEGPLGCYGDAAIHCFWKSLPVPDGGALALPKDTPPPDLTMRSPDFGDVYAKTKPFIKSWMRQVRRKYMGFLYQGLKKQLEKNKGDGVIPARPKEETPFPDMPQIHYFDEKLKVWSISRLSRGFMKNIDPQKVVNIRRRNYLQLFEFLQDLPGIRPLYQELPEGVSPLAMPVLADDPFFWRHAMKKWNIYPLPWWEWYHRDLSWDGFPEAIELKNHTLILPIHQHLDEERIAHMGQKIREAALNSSP